MRLEFKGGKICKRAGQVILPEAEGGIKFLCIIEKTGGWYGRYFEFWGGDSRENFEFEGGCFLFRQSLIQIKHEK